MIITSIQNFSTRKDCTFLNKNSTYKHKQLAQDKVSFCGKKEEYHYEAYNTVKMARGGNEEAIALISKAMELAKKTQGNWNKIFSSSESKNVKEIAKHLSLSNCAYSEFDVYNHPRIYRIIGASEYEPLMKGKHITSELRNNRGVDVTNNMYYGGAHAEGDKAYLITFKLKDNLDAFLSQLPGPHRQNGNSYVNLKNKATSEFILEGGYTLDDVENILEFTNDFSDGKIVYGEPTKKIKIELDNEKKQIPPKAEIPNAKIETPLIDDGINDIGNIGSKSLKSDLDGATDSLSMQDFLKKKNEKLIQHDIDLHEIELPKIDIPDVPNLGLEDLNLSDDIDKISKDIDKSTKSSKRFKPILLFVSIGTSIAGAIYYISKKNKKYNQGLDKKN